MQTMTIQQLTSVSEAGGVKEVALVADGPGFVIEVAQRSGKIAQLRATNKKERRRFINPLQAFKLLRDAGLTVGAFTLDGWNPEDESQRVKRPDRSEAMRDLHDRYREAIDASLVEADDPATEWVSGAQVKKNMATEREELLALINK